ncbi:hypothetical protein M662_07595 [Bacillus sp. SB49]|uniref:hypothetical protein n=1 Tax=Bacillus sp. SB49 TaxID=1071080 RepID=UPI00047CEDF9|nr:hypothetical protein [Bacillus sp. SB49]QHT46363.1 hypothetical protein M662_07595 [Bacillus sp. SB49]
MEDNKALKYFAYEHIVLKQIRVFEEYSSYVEKQLNKESIKYFEEATMVSLDDIDDDTWMKEVDDWLEKHQMYNNDLPKLMRGSLITSIFSFLERVIVSFCYPQEGSVKLEDLRGQGIERARLYIEKVRKMRIYSVKENYA